MKTLARRLVATGFVFLFAAAASAADPAVECQTGKLKVAGKYGACRLKGEAKAVRGGGSPNLTRCADAFSDKWQASETKAGPGVCPTESDEAAIGQCIADHTAAIAVLLAGGSAPDCVSQRFVPASGQTTSYGAGDDGDVQAGATLSYLDNGDGTITDTNTDLMWEKKLGDAFSNNNCSDETGNCANPHRVGNSYTWSDGPCCSETDYDGSAVTIFLEQLNSRCDNDTTVSCAVDADCVVPGGPCGFAGHRDWRLPGLKELQGLVDLGRSNPAVDPAFEGASCGALCTDITDPACSCTRSDTYWSSTTKQSYPTVAWFVSFSSGGHADENLKGNYHRVRAVRSGS